MGGYDLTFQKRNVKLQKELLDVLKVHDEHFLVGLPDVFQGLDRYTDLCNRLTIGLPTWISLSFEILAAGIVYFCCTFMFGNTISKKVGNIIKGKIRNCAGGK